MTNNENKGITAIARDESNASVPCPVSIGSVFTTAQHGDVVMALEITQRKHSVWSVRVVDAVPSGNGWNAGGNERWTSIKVYAGRSRVEVLN